MQQRVFAAVALACLGLWVAFALFSSEPPKSSPTSSQIVKKSAQPPLFVWVVAAPGTDWTANYIKEVLRRGLPLSNAIDFDDMLLSHPSAAQNWLLWRHHTQASLKTLGNQGDGFVFPVVSYSGQFVPFPDLIALAEDAIGAGAQPVFVALVPAKGTKSAFSGNATSFFLSIQSHLGAIERQWPDAVLRIDPADVNNDKLHLLLHASPHLKNRTASESRLRIAAAETRQESGFAGLKNPDDDLSIHRRRMLGFEPPNTIPDTNKAVLVFVPGPEGSGHHAFEPILQGPSFIGFEKLEMWQFAAGKLSKSQMQQKFAALLATATQEQKHVLLFSRPKRSAAFSYPYGPLRSHFTVDPAGFLEALPPGLGMRMFLMERDPADCAASAVRRFWTGQYALQTLLTEIAVTTTNAASRMLPCSEQLRIEHEEFLATPENFFGPVSQMLRVDKSELALGKLKQNITHHHHYNFESGSLEAQFDSLFWTPLRRLQWSPRCPAEHDL